MAPPKCITREPEGSGAGHELAYARNSPFYPEGFYADRAAWVMRDDIINTDPQLVVAFALAQLRAITELKAMDHGQVSQVVEKYWHLTPDLGKQVIDGDILFVCGWAWPSESDARSLIQMSSFMADTNRSTHRSRGTS